MWIRSPNKMPIRPEEINLRVASVEPTQLNLHWAKRYGLFIGIGIALLAITGTIILLRPRTPAAEAKQNRKAAKKAKAQAPAPALDPRAIEALVTRLEDTALRADAGDQLVAIGAPAVPALAKAVANGQTRFGRLEAAKTLARIDDPSAL